MVGWGFFYVWSICYTQEKITQSVLGENNRLLMTFKTAFYTYIDF